MGEHDRVGKVATCLISAVFGALVAVGPQTLWAQEAANSTAPQAGEGNGDDTAAEDSAQAGKAGEPDTGAAPEEAANKDSVAGTKGDSGTTSAPEGSPSTANQTAPAATVTENAASQPTAARKDPSAGESDTNLSPAPAAPDSQSDFSTATPAPAASGDVTEAAPDNSVQTGTEEIPANPTSAATPARAREPMTGAKQPIDDNEKKAAEEAPEVSTHDPLEGMNRVFFKFNDTLDKLFFKPTAEVYRFILPTYLQDRVRNVINNADTPVILANDILQWEWKRAWQTTSRFFINTTIGIGGIFDVAAKMGIERHDEDFGQTMCVWGAGEWFYLYLPFVGPTNPRDITGKAVDRFFDPLSYYADVVQQVNLSNGVKIKFHVDTAGIAQLALTGADLIDLRARNIDSINEIERTSIDFYTAVRSLYRQSRESACRNGRVDFEDLPDLSDEFE